MTYSGHIILNGDPYVMIHYDINEDKYSIIPPTNKREETSMIDLYAREEMYRDALLYIKEHEDKTGHRLGLREYFGTLEELKAFINDKNSENTSG